MLKKLTFVANLKNLRTALSFVKKHCLKMGFEGSICEKIILAIEEALVNIIKHGYKENHSGVIEINCESPEENQGILIIIRDCGVPFNPLERVQKSKKIKKVSTLEEKSVGGYGINLYVELMDKVEYVRQEGVNSLHLIKYL